MAPAHSTRTYPQWQLLKKMMEKCRILSVLESIMMFQEQSLAGNKKKVPESFKYNYVVLLNLEIPIDKD